MPFFTCPVHLVSTPPASQKLTQVWGYYIIVRLEKYGQIEDIYKRSPIHPRIRILPRNQSSYQARRGIQYFGEVFENQICDNQVYDPFSFPGFAVFLRCSGNGQPFLIAFGMVFLFPGSFPLTWPDHPIAFHLVFDLRKKLFIINAHPRAGAIGICQRAPRQENKKTKRRKQTWQISSRPQTLKMQFVNSRARLQAYRHLTSLSSQ